MKKSNFCPTHPKELMRHFCITCCTLICMECIVDHSGHEFVRKEESIYILKENGDKIVTSLEMMAHKTNLLIESGFALGKEVKMRKVKAMRQIEGHFDKVLKEV
jgi:kelch-like protein 10